MTICYARQYSDEMHCAKCRVRWDVNELYAPPCRPLTESGVPIVEAPKLASERLPFKSGLPLDR